MNPLCTSLWFFQSRKMKRYIIVLISVGTLLLWRCEKESETEAKVFEWNLPAGVEPPAVPEGNEMTWERIELGHKLFFDPILSVDSSMSCATCHQTFNGLANPQPVMRGVFGRLGFRNTPTLTQVAYSPYFFAEGGSPTLEMQVLGPIEDHNEFGFNAAELAEKMKGHPVYEALAQKTYGRSFDLFVLTRAIAAYERTMISSGSRFDKYYYEGDTASLTEQEIRGWELFQSDRTNCISCHSGFAFSSYDFANIGLYDEYKDLGLSRRTVLPEDVGKFKIPTLRNVAYTAPYMHDGSIRTLTQVVKHFNEGGVGHPNQSQLVRPLGLDNTEMADLVAFLRSLSDDQFFKSELYQAPL